MSPSLDSLSLYYGAPSNIGTFYAQPVATAEDSNQTRIEVREGLLTGTPVSLVNRYGERIKLNLTKGQGKTVGEAILKESGNADRLKPEHKFNVEVREDGVYVDGLVYSNTVKPGYWASEASYYKMQADAAINKAAKYRAIADAVTKAHSAKANARAEVCQELGFSAYDTLTSSTRKAVDRIVELKNK